MKFCTEDDLVFDGKGQKEIIFVLYAYIVLLIKTPSYSI
jgi:hypothetical protein